MKTSQLLAVAATAALLLPGTALAGKGTGKPSGSQRAAATQTVKFRTLEGPPAATKATGYGRQCAGQSRKRVAGERDTAFSRCVKAMARVAAGRASAKAACKGLSKKHVKGTKGTPFSRCVVAAAKLRETAPVEEVAPLEPTEPETTEPARQAPTGPVETTDPV